jgi:hypothetical protein
LGVISCILSWWQSHCLRFKWQDCTNLGCQGWSASFHPQGPFRLGAVSCILFWWQLYFTLPHEFPWSPRGVLTVLTKSSWSPHGVLTESSQSPQSPHGVLMESSQSPWSPCRVLMESPWTLWGLPEDFVRTMISLVKFTL